MRACDWRPGFLNCAGCFQRCPLSFCSIPNTEMSCTMGLRKIWDNSSTGLPWWLSGKESVANAGDRSRKIPGRRKWQLTPVFLPRRPHGAWRTTVHGLTKSWTWLSDLTRVAAAARACRERGRHMNPAKHFMEATERLPTSLWGCLTFRFPNTGSCAWCTMRQNQLKLWSLEQIKVYCRAMQGEQVAHALKKKRASQRVSNKTLLIACCWEGVSPECVIIFCIILWLVDVEVTRRCHRG